MLDKCATINCEAPATTSMTYRRHGSGDGPLHDNVCDGCLGVYLCRPAIQVVQLRTDTTHLRMGDVVLGHGMRVLLDRNPNVFTAWGSANNLPVYAWIGQVVDGPPKTDAFLWSQVHGVNAREQGRWNVQGNARAQWTFERTAEAASV